MATRVDEDVLLRGSAKRSRRIPDNEYELYRSEIMALYLQGGRSREEIRNFLAVEHKFNISLKQLKHRLYKWKARKNCKRFSRTEGDTQTGKRGRASTTRRLRYTVSKTGRNSLTSEVPSLSRHSSIEPRYTESGQENPVQYQKHNDNLQPSLCVGGGGSPVPLQYVIQPGSPNQYTCARETAPGVQSPDFEDPVSSTIYSDICSGIPSQTFVVRPPRALEGVSKTFGGEQSPQDVPQAFQNDVSGDHPTSVSNVSPAQDDLMYGQSPSTALAVAVAMSTDSITSGQTPDCNGTSLDIFQDATSFTSLEEPPPPHSNDEDPIIVSEALLALRSIYRRFLACGGFWQTSSDYALLDPNYLEVFGAFTHQHVRTALDTILSRYLMLSVNWLTPPSPTTTPSSSTSNTTPCPKSETRRLSAVSNSHNLQTMPTTKQSSLPGEGHLVVLSLAARDSNADMIKLQLQRWSERFQGTVSADKGLTMTMSFLPRAFERKMGISLTLSASFWDQAYTRLHPTLKTFGVVPLNSAVIQCIHRNDISGIRDLFSSGLARPSDVDSEGCSLISHAVRHRRLDIFRLLLDAGADCEDVANGHDIVAVIWGYYMLRDADKDLFEETKEAMEMTRLSQERSGDRQYYRDMIVAGINVLNKSKRAQQSIAAPVIQHFVNLFAVESPGPSGRTPLLCASMINSTMSLEASIKRRANLQARDKFGRGALHSALYTRSYIVCPENCEISEQEAHHQCSCPAEPILHDCHYIHAWRECPRNKSGLEKTLRILLWNGCDPNSLDGYDYSPSDYVREIPELHTIWTKALAEAGYTWDSTLRMWQRFVDMGDSEWGNNVTSWSSCYAELSTS
ncbi:hypothetical protein H2200_012714 [Cladophialophora chaetospira]|uniref:Clr5 domain-containing protein n=1 Tax=Cladophialophora chaetospira TaxID=386627 RepID=A0AA38WXH0_9EURO|nr:hypothetical protein H2200_012714 [Cladophialophora chaetospira]